MPRIIELKNGEKRTCLDNEDFLRDVIYDKLGSDCYEVFVEYVEGIDEYIDYLEETVKELRLNET